MSQAEPWTQTPQASHSSVFDSQNMIIREKGQLFIMVMILYQ